MECASSAGRELRHDLIGEPPHRALDLTDQISAIKMPTIAIVGEDDPGTPVAAHKVIQERIAGSKLEILKSAAHLSNMEQPEAFNKALTGFLTSL